ncbi:hypothetical protein [Streptomyces hirsutus]|uniref:hypothetical protein n=1 Tax=Streptomyces hirsutus TaxID=35620 RepID=UPI0006E16A8E|nr:hypothetical protein [Streptomyces hirsutus]
MKPFADTAPDSDSVASPLSPASPPSSVNQPDRLSPSDLLNSPQPQESALSRPGQPPGCAVRLLRRLRAVAPRALLAAVPVVTFGVLGPLPSLVIAIRRRGRTHWLMCGLFTAVTVAWLLNIAFTPEETHGLSFGVDLMLLLLTTAGTVVHCLFAWPARAVPSEKDSQ